MPDQACKMKLSYITEMEGNNEESWSFDSDSWWPLTAIARRKHSRKHQLLIRLGISHKLIYLNWPFYNRKPALFSPLILGHKLSCQWLTLPSPRHLQIHKRWIQTCLLLPMYVKLSRPRQRHPGGTSNPSVSTSLLISRSYLYLYYY
jgi:hypothetical protein